MKRLLAAILAVCYLCLSTGFTLHVHYCMGKQVSTSLIKPNDDHKCSYCGMNKKSSKKSCCKDEYKIVKQETKAAFAKVFVHHTPVVDALMPSAFYFSHSSPVTTIAQQYISGCRPHGPPLASDVPLHVRNCSFLI